MKIAHFSPLPPHSSGIAEYCARLLPFLAARISVDIYAEGGKAIAGHSVYSIKNFLQNPEKRFAYDLCLYHMGNHPAYHSIIYECLLRYPGVVNLHEINLHAFMAQNPANYQREMGFAHGRGGINQARLVQAGQDSPAEVAKPLFNRILRKSLGIVVQTEFARRMLQSRPGSKPIATIPLAVEIPGTKQPPPNIIRQLPPETITLASFGVLASSKRLPIVLKALASLRDELPPFRYILVGQPIAEFAIQELIQELALEEIVLQTGFVDTETYGRCLQHIDIGVNLRTGPTGGEMSASLMDLMAHGRPAIVSNVGGFADLPDEAVIKIDQNEDEFPQLKAAVKQLVSNESLRRTIGDQARQYVAEHSGFPQVAQQYVDFLDVCWQFAGQQLEVD